MKKYIILLLTSIITTSFAQNTGYMGRHFIINAEASFSPAFVKPTFNKKRLCSKISKQKSDIFAR